MTRVNRSRLLSAGVGALLAGAIVQAPTVQAAAPTGGATERVTLALAPQNPAGLKALAHTTTLSRGQRAAALSHVIPSAQARGDVAAVARRLGLKVERSSTWAVQVSGPASLVRQLFGSARANNPQSRFGHNLPAVPAVFGRNVITAFGGDETRPAFRHMAAGLGGTWNGADVKAQYSAADGATSGVQTIATVQMSDWNPADLTAYAAAVGSPAPVSYTGIKDPFVPPSIDNSGSDLEVNLDQETIYSVFPQAQQRAYLAGNTAEGMFDNLVSIGNDASDPTFDYHITAASISWGACEDASPAAAPMYDAFESVLQYVVASGVTVFASSGDSGMLCNGAIGVSYPASSPEVIAVGGTQPANPNAAPPTAEQSWFDAGGSSGGGTSALFFKPSWQPGVGTRRMIPDIAALAGTPGFATYTSNASFGHDVDLPAGWLRLHGTSLASPATAALMTYELAKHNYEWGIGAISAALYADTADFTDITGGLSAGVGYDFATGLGTPKWDALVTKLGGDPHLSVQSFFSNSLTPAVTVHAPDFQTFTAYRLAIDTNPQCGAYATSPTAPTVADFNALGPVPPHSWDGLNSLTLVAVDSNNACHFANSFVFIDTQKPVAKTSIGLTSATSGAKVTARWSFADAGPSSGLDHFSVQIVDQANHVVWSNASATGAGVTFNARQGFTYTVKAQAVDLAKNASAVSSASFTVPADDRYFSYSSGWGRSNSTRDYAGSNTFASGTGATARYTAAARSYVLWLVTGPNGGKANVYVGSTLVRTIDLYSSSVRYRVPVTVYSSTSLATRTITVRVAGQKNPASHGFTVYLDAIQAKR